MGLSTAHVVCTACGKAIVAGSYFVERMATYCPACFRRLALVPAEEGPKPGWRCPQCGSIYSPFVDRCRTCGPRHKSGSTFEVTIQGGVAT